MSKTSKIVTICVVALVSLIVVATIVLAIVPKHYYDVVYSSTSGQAQNIQVYSKGKTNVYTSDSAEYASIVSNYKSGLKENLLLSLFEGSLGYKSSIDKYTTPISLNDANSTYVVFRYGQDQTLLFDGSQVKDNDEPITFRYIVLSVTNDSNYVKSVNAYICTAATDTATPIYKLTTLAKQYQLLQYISTLALGN